MRRTQPQTRLLDCATCSNQQHSFERGWRAYQTTTTHRPTITILCPDCAEREHGEDSP